MTLHRLPDPESNLKWPVRIAQIVSQTRAEGPGERFAIWFQGCPFRCLGCCNPEMLSDQGGRESTVAAVLSQLDWAMETAPNLEGITLLGGEPFAQAGAAAAIAMHARKRGLSVMIFTGYKLNELEKSPDLQIQELLRHADLLVDGLYERGQPDSRRRWIGSQNQEIHFLTNR